MFAGKLSGLSAPVSANNRPPRGLSAPVSANNRPPRGVSGNVITGFESVTPYGDYDKYGGMSNGDPSDGRFPTIDDYDF